LIRHKQITDSVIESIPSMMFMKRTSDLRFVLFNKAGEDLIGITSADVLGKNDYDLFPREQADFFTAKDREVIRKGFLDIPEEVIETRNHGRRILHTRKIVLRDSHGEPEFLLGLSSDITERMAAINRLELHSEILLNMQEGVQITRVEDERIVYATPRFEAMFGYGSGELKGQHVSSLNAPAFDSPEEIAGQINQQLLVREVHHRIKNNLQGIVGVLRQYAEKHPLTADPINQAISQVQSIAVIHGLQGRSTLSSVRLCELTNAIASGVESIWQQPVTVDIPDAWTPCLIKEPEAVPLALVLNELISNAVKHRTASEPIIVTLRHEPNPESISICIYNTGQLPSDFKRNLTESTGLQLVLSLLPRYGAQLSWHQQGDKVVTMLELDAPAITLEQHTEITDAS
jgi:PAS domain S-box-containing protein